MKKKGFEDSYVVEGKMALPYTYFAGRVGSKFITTIRDQKKIMGVKCPKCNKVYMPPRQTCEIDFTDIRDNWVDLKNTGEVTNFTVVRYDDKHLPRKAPFLLAMIKLDGADTPFVHILEEIKVEEVKIGMRVEAVFAKETTNTILDIDHFKPAKESKIEVSDRSAGIADSRSVDSAQVKNKNIGGKPDMSQKAIITAALTGAATMREQNKNVPYEPHEFAEEALKCYKAGAAMVHVHARESSGMPTHDHARIKETHDAIKEKCPEIIVNLSSAVGMGKTAEQRI